MHHCKCGKSFERKSSLTTHARFCNVYEKSIKQSSYLKDSGLYECECGKSYENPQSLNSHFRWCIIHRDGKPVVRSRGGGWNKGKKKENDSGVKKMAESLTGKPRKKWTLEQKNKLSSVLKGKNGGYREGTNKWRGGYIIEPSGKKVWLDSSYEIRFIRIMNKFEIKWKKNYKAFPYIFEGIQKKYIPDFYLEDLDLWIETKGWEKERDKFKWQTFPYELKIVRIEDLKRIESIENLQELFVEFNRPGGEIR